MIKFSVDTSYVAERLDNLYWGMEEVIKPAAKTAIAKASFTILANQFNRDLATAAKANRKKYHHVYEWDKTGVIKDRLYELRRTSVTSGNLKISPYFLESNTIVPIPKVLATPGKTGKAVTAQHIFKDKAQVMELGRPTRPFTATGGRKALAFLATSRSKKITFIRVPQAIVINSPGGKATTGSFFKYLESWFGKQSKIDGAIKKSGMMKNLETQIDKTLSRDNRNDVTAVRATIIEVTNNYSKGVDRV